MEKIKQCSDCRRFLGESSFRWNKYKNRKNGGHYKSCCKKCDRNRSILYYESTREKQIIKMKNYRNKHKDRFSRYRKEYKRNNKGLINKLNANYRAKKLQATISWANQEIIDYIYKECDELNKLYPLINSKPKFHVDHYYPLQGETMCGLHHENNLHIITAFENVSKNNKCPEKDIQLNRRI